MAYLYTPIEDTGSINGSNPKEQPDSSVSLHFYSQDCPQSSAAFVSTMTATSRPRDSGHHHPNSHISEARYETVRLLGSSINGDLDEEPKRLEINETNKRIASQQFRTRHTSHTPIPATTVFARDAAPLYLPELDSYISKFPAPSFSRFTSGVRVGKTLVGPGMFPPMDRLAATNKTLLDLETNRTVAPAWRNRETIFGAISNTVLSVTGSSVVATFYSLHGLINVLQIFALILNSIIPRSSVDAIKNDWKELFLGVIPNVLALNFGTTVFESSVVLLVFISGSMILLYVFWSKADKIEDQNNQEGFPLVQPEDKGWRLIFVCSMLSVFYLPLSTIITHALVWSDDFWAVSNPYTNATSNPPSLPPLGPPDEFYDPLDFCYTTTMKRNEINFAPIIVVISAVSFLAITIWFPLRLRNVIRQSIPKVDPFTDRGTRRSGSELDREYQRLLHRDKSPISFLYSDFRRGWGTYKSTYLFAKLSALFIVSVISPDNCLFRTLSRTHVTITRQAVLSLAMLFFFLLQCFRAPFINPVSNASEWTSRLNYLATSLVGLAVAFNVSGSVVLDGPVLYIIYILTYGFAIYFTLINFAWMQRIVKCLTGRVDFSIDIFSPRIDLSPSSPHVKWRTWQETITTLLLTSPDCRIPKHQPMLYATARESEYPPYLLGFCGSPAERHVENLKILREVGLKEYIDGCRNLGDRGRAHALHDRIQCDFVGPDMAWVKPGPASQPMTRFGTAWWIPFPPTLVLRYDDGGYAVLNRSEQFEDYVRLNDDGHIQRKRRLRLAFRSLDGHVVRWPFEYREIVGDHQGFLCFCRRYRVRRVVLLKQCIFRIRRKGRLVWRGVDLGSGFDVELDYSKDIKISGDILGLSDEWELTPILARFLVQNQSVVSENLPKIEWAIDDYRNYHRTECKHKAAVLSYDFLLSVYGQPQLHKQLVQYISEGEKDLRVRDLALAAEDAFTAGCERFEQAVSSKAAAWWYIFWDDLWRRNYDTIKNLRLHEQDFNPHYPTSIAYTPLPRPALENFLRQRGLYGSSTLNAFFHPGLLNKMYFWLCEIVFRNSSHAVLLHVGGGTSEFNLSEIDVLSHARSSSLGTGGGTDLDDVSIRARPAYRWEGLLEDPIRKCQRESSWIAKLGAWLGLTPLWRTGMITRGIALDVKLEDGRYVMIYD